MAPPYVTESALLARGEGCSQCPAFISLVRDRLCSLVEHRLLSVLWTASFAFSCGQPDQPSPEQPDQPNPEKARQKARLASPDAAASDAAASEQFS